MAHFLYGFILVTLLFELLGQFPSSGHPLKLLVDSSSGLVATGACYASILG